MSSRGCDHFVDEIRRLIGRLRAEYEMTYAEVVGCLELVKSEIVCEAMDEQDSA